MRADAKYIQINTVGDTKNVQYKNTVRVVGVFSAFVASVFHSWKVASHVLRRSGLLVSVVLSRLYLTCLRPGVDRCLFRWGGCVRAVGEPTAVAGGAGSSLERALS